MPFEIVSPKFNNPVLLKSKIFYDERGYFFETYKKPDFQAFGFTDEFIQDNVSRSYKNVLRGMHYQLDPKSQGKLVCCLKGEILDVIVDMRKGSPNFGKWQSYALSNDSGYVLYVPEGFAHGFLVKTDEAIFLYKTTKENSPAHEAGFVWNDPEVNIDWGIYEPNVSEKDKKLPLFKDAIYNFVYH